MKIHVVRKLLEMIVEQSFRSNYHFETLYILEKGISILGGNLNSGYLITTVRLFLSFPPSGTWAFYIIKRPTNLNILVPSVGEVSFLGITP